MKQYKLKINGKEYTVDIESMGEDTAEVTCNGVGYKVEYEEPQKKQAEKSPRVSRKATVPESSGGYTAKPSDASSANAIKAPIPGLITQVLVSEGDTVKSGQVVAQNGSHENGK
ncbi:MAG: biotin/lipoyl-binding protein [Candidatus Marinimicrobia bacterium]|nr:biotin/lipoyl-binding protein [Candidatus Neomarinimicrobiota bacterium]